MSTQYLSDEWIENRPLNDLTVGDTASLSRTLTEDDVTMFAILSGDVNPAHVDEDFARDDLFHQVVGHGMWGASLISTLLGTQLPGPGTIYLGQTLSFRAPVRLGDTVTVSVTVSRLDEEKHQAWLDCTAVRQDGVAVIAGESHVLVPTEKVRRNKVALPTLRLVQIAEQDHPAAQEDAAQ